MLHEETWRHSRHPQFSLDDEDVAVDYSAQEDRDIAKVRLSGG